MSGYLRDFSLALLVIHAVSCIFTGIGSLLSSVGYLWICCWLGWNIVKIYKRFSPRYVPQHVGLAKVDPTDKAVLITGCDTGFGNAVARTLATRGFRVYAACLFPDRDGARELDVETGDNLTIIKMDVTSNDDVSAAVDTIEKDLKGKGQLVRLINELTSDYFADKSALWGLVNNAGLGCWHGLEWGPKGVDALYRPLWEVNVLGCVRVTKSFLPLIRRRRGGRIVLVSSAAGRYTYPTLVPYCMTKHAVRSFGDGLRRELGSGHAFGIHVSTIEPGLYQTPINDWDRTMSEWQRRFAEMPQASRTQYDAAPNVESNLRLALEGLIRAQRPQTQEVVEDIVAAIETAGAPFTYYRPTGYLAALVFYFLELFPDEILDHLLSPKMVQIFGKVLHALQW